MRADRQRQGTTATRMHLFVGLAMVACMAVLVVWTLGRLREERHALLEWFAEQRLQQLSEATAGVDQDLLHIDGDLALAAAAIERSGPAAVGDTLTALLALARPYRIAGLYGVRCERTALYVDPRWVGPIPATWTAALDATAVEACHAGPDEVITSLPLDDPEHAWNRVFARRMPGGDEEGDGPRSVAFLVDTRPTLERLRTVTSDRATELLVLGPHDRPTPISAPRLARAVDDASLVTFHAAVRAMADGQRVSVLVPAQEAESLGFPDADLLFVAVPIAIDGGESWSAAAVVSTVELREREVAVLWRLGSATGFAALVLGLLGAYVVVVARRDAAYEERVRGAESQAHLRERSARILDHVPSLVAALDPEGRVTAHNAALADRIPAGRDGGTLAERFPGTPSADLALLADLVRDAAASSEPVIRMARRLHLAGTDGRFTVRAVPIRPASPDVACLLVIEDLTDVHNLQDQLMRAEKLATVGVLAAGIAHEVGTPLGVIRGRAEYAANKLGPDHPQTAGLGVIVDQIDRIVRTLRALLDFAAPHAVAPGRVDLVAVGDRVANLVSFELQRRHQALVVDLPPTLRPVAGDEDQLQQVLVNLVMNASEASAEGASIRISATETGDRVRVRVSDQGRGIPPENLQRVFDPFFTTRPRGEGTGLGLAIVSQIVRDHGGVVRIDSEPGVGTMVEVELTAHREGHPGAA